MSNSKIKEEDIITFLSLVGDSITPKRAEEILKESGGDVNVALDNFLENQSKIPQPKNTNDIREPIKPQRLTLADQEGDFSFFDHPPRPKFPQEAKEIFDQLSPSTHNKRKNTKIEKHIDNLKMKFRPPFEIIEKGDFNFVCTLARKRMRYLIVDIQNVKEFDCHRLCRDTWSSDVLKDLIKQTFVFWQMNNDSALSSGYMNFYTVNKYPHIALIDPRTRERVKIWEHFLDAQSFMIELIDYLENNPLEGQASESNDDNDTIISQFQTDEWVDSSSESDYGHPSDTSYEEIEPVTTRGTKRKLRNGKIINDKGNQTTNQKDNEIFFDSDKEIMEPPTKKIKISQSTTETEKQSENPIKSDIPKNKNIEPPIVKLKKTDDPDIVTYIQLRLPGGNTIKEAFSSNAYLQSVLDLGIYEINKEGSVTGNKTYSLVTAFPRKKYKSEDLQTLSLHDAKLVPRAVLIMEENVM